MTKKKALLAGIAIGIASIALVASSATPTTPAPVPSPVETALPADPAPTPLPEPIEVEKPDLPEAPTPAPTPTYDPADDAEYIPSTNDCGEGAYRIEPGTCEWYTDPDEDIGGAALLDYCVTEDDTYCYWDAAIQGNGQGRSFVNVGNMTYYLP